MISLSLQQNIYIELDDTRILLCLFYPSFVNFFITPNINIWRQKIIQIRSMALDFAATYKVLVLGDSNVGKTCIVHRYCDERYYDTYISTIGNYNSCYLLPPAFSPLVQFWANDLIILKLQFLLQFNLRIINPLKNTCL